MISDDELKIIMDLISVFYSDEIFCTLSRNLEGIVSILSTKYLKKWSQCDFTDVKSGRAAVEFHTECYLLSAIDDEDCSNFLK